MINLVATLTIFSGIFKKMQKQVVFLGGFPLKNLDFFSFLSPLLKAFLGFGRPRGVVDSSLLPLGLSVAFFLWFNVWPQVFIIRWQCKRLPDTHLPCCVLDLGSLCRPLLLPFRSLFQGSPQVSSVLEVANLVNSRARHPHRSL